MIAARSGGGTATTTATERPRWKEYAEERATRATRVDENNERKCRLLASQRCR